MTSSCVCVRVRWEQQTYLSNVYEKKQCGGLFGKLSKFSYLMCGRTVSSGLIVQAVYEQDIISVRAIKSISLYNIITTQQKLTIYTIQVEPLTQFVAVDTGWLEGWL